MKTVCKKLLCLMLVAMLLVSAVPAAFAAEGDANVLYVELKDDAGNKLGSTQKVDVTVGDSFSADEVKAFAEEKYPEYLTNDYEVVSAPAVTITDGTNGVVVIAKAKEVSTDPCADGHDWDEGVMTTPDTCDAAGVKTFTCKRTDCGETRTQEVDEIIGHMLAGDKCMNRYSDGTKCTYVRPTASAPVAGDLTVYAYVKTEDTDYVNFNGGRPIVLEGKADAARDKALAEAVIGKQLIDFRWMGYEKDDNGDATVNLNATILEGTNGKNVYKLRVYTNDATSNYKQIDIYEGEGILAAIKNAGITPKYEDHVLVGYLDHMNGNSSSYLTIYDVAKAEDADENGVIKVWADWREKTDDDDEDYEYGEGGGLYGEDNDDPIYDVVLYIYTNGKTSSYAKKVSASSMGKHTKDGVLSRDEVELVVEKYFKTYEDTKYYGLFTKYYWNDGNYLTENAKYSIELDPDETNYVYVMVKNAKAYVADSSNPKTGDYITIAFTTMGLAAAALVSMNELKKRKMI